jgi:phage regulator Rha-like protein
VAEKLEVPHKVLVQTIERILEKYGHRGASTFGQIFVETTTINKQKREYKSYDMNEDAFMKLIMNL